MRSLVLYSVAILACWTSVADDTLAQTTIHSSQIALAVLPLPDEYRDEAAVLGYGSDGIITMVRSGSNELVCIGDDPSDDRFHVACYHVTLEPFMTRGRELRAEGKEREEVKAIRRDEILSGQLAFPEGPVALYSLSGPLEFLEADVDDLSSLSKLKVLYIPFATPESTGLSSTPVAGEPWLMDAGEPWAHVMLYRPAAKED